MKRPLRLSSKMSMAIAYDPPTSCKPSIMRQSRVPRMRWLYMAEDSAQLSWA